MKPIFEILQEKLKERVEANSYRELNDFSKLIDFSSNDYLGFAKSDSDTDNYYGSTGSRLISGNTNDIEHLELEIANYHGMEAGLIFNSGYVANLGLFSAIPQRGDTIIYDELIHASIRDGIRLSNANAYAFEHNNLLSLEAKLKKAKGNIFVAIESVYSMDGDSPNVTALIKLCKQYKVNLVVDEAHSVGVVGNKGEGLIAKLGLQDEVFATIVTFGKALGCHGAIVLGNNILRNYLINFCRPFIYTTAPSPETIKTIRQQYAKLKRTYLTESIDSNVAAELKNYFIEKISPICESFFTEYGNIVSVIIPGNGNVKSVSKELEVNGLFVKYILSPTVPKGMERLRICFHSFNSINEVNKLIDVIESNLKRTN